MKKFLAFSLQACILGLGILSIGISIFNPNTPALISLTVSGLLLVIASSIFLGALIEREVQLHSLQKQLPATRSGEKSIGFHGPALIEINPATTEVLKAMCELGDVELKDLFNDGLVHLRWMTKEVVGGAEITAINSSRESLTGLASPYLSNVAKRCQMPEHLLATSHFKLVSLPRTGKTVESINDNDLVV